MTMVAYYNDNEPYVAQWLRNLVSAGLLPAGDVDERSIVDVQPDDLRGYSQCHFFAGIGGWPLALELAGWGDGEVWTCSCPCQPLSCAGQRKGHVDKRHLWPAFYRLVAEFRPAIVFGEQVAGKDGFEWLSAVRADMEATGYAFGAADLCAASVGAPHIRQRLFFVANANFERGSAWTAQERRQARGADSGMPKGLGFVAHRVGAGLEVEREQSARQECASAERSGAAGELGNANGARSSERNETSASVGHWSPVVATGELGNATSKQMGIPRFAWEQRNTIGELGNSKCELTWRNHRASTCAQEWSSMRAVGDGARPSGSTPWSDFEWLYCLDGKARPAQPGLHPLAHGIPARVGKLRAYGNAIVPPLAAEFIRAAREAISEYRKAWETAAP